MAGFSGQRVLDDLRTLAGFGRHGTGVHRPPYTPQDMAARQWFAEQLRAIGQQVETDGVGNVLGRSPNAGPALLVGSHIETQPYGGWLDGALGVIYGLEAARALPGLPIDVAAWADEEGHFGNFVGTKSYVGMLSEADIDEATNRHDGGRLRAALQGAGLAGVARPQIDTTRIGAYLEAHIEQGDELESSGDRLGIVTSIVGIWQYRIAFAGVQNHAGTTRMAIRRDAGAALVRLASAVAARFPEVAGPRSVWTVGRITLSPGAPSIIPGGAEMLLQFRDADPAILERLQETLQALVAEADRDGPCRVTLETMSRSVPKLMDPRLQAALDAAAERAAPGRHRRMPSGAGHDAQILATKVPSAMLFVPSIGGISHHVSENTSDEDIALGAEAFVEAARAIASDRAMMGAG